MRKLALLLILPAFFLAGCPSMVAETPSQHVYAIQVQYNALLAVAVAYESQPRCSDTQPQPCSDTGIVDEIRKADNDAWVALLKAQEFVRAGNAFGEPYQIAMNGVMTAINAFHQILVNRGLM